MANHSLFLLLFFLLLYAKSSVFVFYVVINYYKFSSLEHTQVLFTAVSVDPESRHGLGGPPSAFGLTHLQARPRRATGVTSAPRLCQVVGRMSFRGAFGLKASVSC